MVCVATMRCPGVGRAGRQQSCEGRLRGSVRAGGQRGLRKREEMERCRTTHQRKQPWSRQQRCFPHLIFRRCKETFLCKGTAQEQRCFPSPPFSLSKAWSLPGTASAALHHYQGEAAMQGATDLNEAVVH